jgi:formate dehydrogenase/NADH-quinone oxidoreductase subunit F
MNLLRELSRVQARDGHLSDEALTALSRELRVPLHEIEGVVSFYPHFRRTAAPRVRVDVCRDISCRLRGAPDLLERLEQSARGHDGVEVEAVSCLGLCDQAPACRVNDAPADPADAERWLESGSVPERPLPAAESWKIDPHPPGAQYAELERWLESGLDGVTERLARSGLRGMGGAGFPAARKWELVRDAPGDPKYAVCNADESEPGTFKDRVVLEQLPHLVIEGFVLAALAVGAEQGFVYIRHEYERPRRALERAIAQARERGVLGPDVLGSGRRFELEVFVSPGGYVLGDETALLEALEGRRGEPRNKPPYPGIAGLHGRPTLVHNVETLAQVPRALATGRADLKWFSVSGDVVEPRVLEVPLGTTLRELVELCGGVQGGREIAAFLPGGASTGFLAGARADLPMDWTSLAEAGSALGSGAVVVVAEGRDLLDIGLNLTEFFRNESCGKCVPCRVGTEKAVELGQSALVPITSLLDLGSASG